MAWETHCAPDTQERLSREDRAECPSVLKGMFAGTRVHVAAHWTSISVLTVPKVVTSLQEDVHVNATCQACWRQALTWTCGCMNIECFAGSADGNSGDCAWMCVELGHSVHPFCGLESVLLGSSSHLCSWTTVPSDINSLLFKFHSSLAPQNQRLPGFGSRYFTNPAICQVQSRLNI